MGFGEQLMSLVSSSLAQSTWTGYGKVWEEWLGLASGRRVDVSDPVHLEVTVDYLLRLRDSNVSAAMAQRKLASISFHFKLRGWSDITKTFVIRQALKGWRREYARLTVDAPFLTHFLFSYWKPRSPSVPLLTRQFCLGLVFA